MYPPPNKKGEASRQRLNYSEQHINSDFPKRRIIVYENQNVQFCVFIRLSVALRKKGNKKGEGLLKR